jgi:hypothetical protein
VLSTSIGDVNERGKGGKSATGVDRCRIAAKHVLSRMDAVLGQFTCILLEVEERVYWEGHWHATDIIKFFTERGFVRSPATSNFRFQYDVILCR